MKKILLFCMLISLTVFSVKAQFQLIDSNGKVLGNGSLATLAAPNAERLGANSSQGKTISMDFKYYSDDASAIKNLRFNTQAQQNQYFAIFVPGYFAGKQITAVKFKLVSLSEVSNVKAWASKKLPKTSEAADICESVATPLTENTVTLSTPLTIPEEGCYVGYSFFSQGGTTSSCMWWYDYPLKAAGANYRCAEDAPDWRDYSGDGYCSNLVATISGEFASNDVVIDNQYQEIIATKGSVVEAALNVKNIGSSSLDNLEYTITDAATGNLLKTAVLNTHGVAPGKSCGFAFDLGPTDALTQTRRVVTITKVNGEEITKSDRVVSSGMVKVLAQFYPRKVVVEEGTGTWCGFCPRGIVGMEKMYKEFPDNFIGIAVHDDNEMGVGENYNSLISLFSGFPGCIANRLEKYNTDPNENELRRIISAEKDKGEAQIEAQAYWKDGNRNEVTVTTASRFAYSGNNVDVRIAYAVTEDGVGPYMQANYYSGGSLEGWGDKDSRVSTVFNDVARGIYDYNGVSGSVPGVINVGDTYNYEYTFTLPSNVANKDNVNIVAMLINGETGEIMNADKVKPQGDSAEELPKKMEFSYAKSPRGGSGSSADRIAGGAMKITSDISRRFAGCKITEISIVNGTFYNQQEAPMEIFFSRGLNEKGFYTQKGYMDINYPEEYKTYLLDTPYTLTAGEEFFIGFTVWTAGVTSDNKYSRPVYRDNVQHQSYPGGYVGNVYRSETKKFFELNWEDEGRTFGMVCIKLTIEGDNLPTNLVEMTDFSVPDYITPKVKTDLGFSFINRGVNSVESLDFTYEVDGEKVSQQKTFSPVAYNQSYYCNFDFEPQNEGAGKILHLTIDRVNGQPAGTTAVHEAMASFNTLFYENGFRYNMVIEEGTGLGCGWCVRGIVGLERTMEAYPDGTFIPISVHSRYDHSDLVPIGYDLLWERHLTHNPTCLINRNLQRFGIEDPSDYRLKRIYETYQSIPAISEVGDITCDKDGDRLKVSSTVKFAFSENDADYKVAYVVTEDNVGPYRQYNAYSGGTTVMGGWELLPSYVDIKHNFVARAISNFDGTCGDIPSKIEKGTIYHHTDYLSLEKVTDINNTYIIALVINGHNGRIENALRKKIDPSLFTSIEDVVNDIEDNENSVEYYDLAGRRVFTPQNGIFIRRQGDKVQKIQIR